MSLNDDKESLKAALIATGEPWSQTWHNILTLDPSYFKAYTALRSVPISKQCLPRKTQELILLAMDSSCTHLYEPGVRVHIAAALKGGASKGEIMETLELTSVLGVHAVTAGVPCLQDVMRELGKESKASSTTLDEKRQAMKDDFIARRGYWSESWPPVLQLSPEFFKAYTDYSGVPFEEDHRALDAGASKGEIMETLELTSVLGVHAVTAGVPCLQEVMRELGKESKASSATLNEKRQAMKADFIARRGYWSESWPPVLQLSPEFFKAYTDYSGVPFEEDHRALDAKTKELIYCAIDCATTHLYLPGLKIHIKNAINYGASEEEIMEVFELAALMGAQTVKLGADVITGELEKR